MDLVTRFDGIVRQLNNLREPVTPVQLYPRFLEASLQSKGTHHQLLATAIYTNPVPFTYDQMKVRFEKSALSTHLGPQHHLLLEMQLRSKTSALVAPPLLPRHTSQALRPEAPTAGKTISTSPRFWRRMWHLRRKRAYCQKVRLSCKGGRARSAAQTRRQEVHGRP
jgi:hypothetical protein